jgi:two-component system, OmpR family, response regulator
MRAIKPRILISEDDFDTRDLLCQLLGAEGYLVTCAESGIEALDLAQKQKFQLYLLDNWMPGLTGAELTRKIREFDNTTPILFYSGVAEVREIQDAITAGAQGYLVKPVENDQLIVELARLISDAKPIALAPAC